MVKPFTLLVQVSLTFYHQCSSNLNFVISHQTGSQIWILYLYMDLNDQFSILRLAYDPFSGSVKQMCVVPTLVDTGSDVTTKHQSDYGTES